MDYEKMMKRLDRAEENIEFAGAVYRGYPGRCRCTDNGESFGVVTCSNSHENSR